MSRRHPRCLVIVAFEALLSGTVAQHVAALRMLSAYQVEVVHVGTLNWFKTDLSRFEVIVFHYSIAIAKGFHIRAALRDRLAVSKALKVLFIQDEYRWIDATAEAIKELGISVLFTVLNEDVVEQVYHHAWLKGVRKELTLTGFVDEALLRRAVPPYGERKIDVAYRARKVPFWLGSFAAEKWTVGEKFLRQTNLKGLSCDISSDESARLYGEAWIQFLSNAKAVLGTESGASVCDFSGKLQAEVEAAVKARPGVDFETIRNEVLRDVDGRIVIHVISPRIFEAAALRTLMINYPGEYSGRLVPWRHYVPLAKDHSNVDEVIEVLRDSEKSEQIVDAAYREVACNPQNTFRAMVAHFDRVVREELGLQEMEMGARYEGRTFRRRVSCLEAMSWFEFRGMPIVRRVLRPAYSHVRWVYRQVLPECCRVWLRKKIAR